MNDFEKTINKLLKNLPLIMGLIILLMDVIAFLAPILAHLGADSIAGPIYTVYSFLCHQRPWRSIHIYDHQVAWCTRDTFIYLAMGLSSVFVTKFKIRKVSWKLALISIIPFALDGGIQFIAEMQAILNDKETFFYASTNFFRMLTGAIFGTGAGLWLFSLLSETVEMEFIENTKKLVKKVKEKKKVHYLKYFAVIVSICFAFYLVIVQVWNLTSPNYGPSGIFDNVRYFPGVNYEDVSRGAHGVNK